MCMGGGAPKAPAKAAEAPTAPATERQMDRNRSRRQRTTGTILTSGAGARTTGATESKTLLGS